MSAKRVVYQNWIVEIGCDPAKLKTNEHCNGPLLRFVSLDVPLTAAINTEELRRIIKEKESREEIRRAVRMALEKLTEQEREFIRQFHFMGKSYREISKQSSRPVYKLEALHKRAVKKLKKELSTFVRERFGINVDVNGTCPICQSPHAAEISKLIAERDKTATWKPVIKIIREKYGFKITSPQVLIGHEKYHRPVRS